LNSSTLNTKIEIFCGTGGVGKTTLATSRALALSAKNKKVLLITIDPSKRLKQILNLKDSDAGEKHFVEFNDDLISNEKVTFDAILMSPTHTFKEMNLLTEKPNKILEILMRPNGGMNEIMAIIEVQKHINSKLYDVIVLDTPPGKHFLDFLKATQKIDRFFDKSFIELFKFFGKKFTNTKIGFTPKKVLGLVVSTGLKKLLKYLELVTGKEFVEEFVDAIFTLYNNKEKFVAALSFQKHIENDSAYELFLVASTEQQKLDEILEIQKKSSHFSSEKTSVLINKSNKKRLDLVDERTLTDDEKNILSYFKLLEDKVNDFSNKYFGKFKTFEESLSTSPKQQVFDLVQEWEGYDKK
jgi:anion-transporting  ArsA/GET3 family ATPase